MGYSSMWDKVAELLTELSRKDEVQYRVKATPESVDAKLCKIRIKSRMAISKLELMIFYTFYILVYG